MREPNLKKDPDDDLVEISQRLQTTPRELRIIIENVGEGGGLRRLVEKDGSLNIVNERRISSLLPEFKKLMRVECFTLMIFFFLLYTVLLTLGSCLIYVTNITHRSATNSRDWSSDCWFQVDSFYDSFLLTFEIVTTIGYGERQPNPECSSGVVGMMILHLLGVVFICSFSGVFLAWFNNTETGEVRFSRIGVITQDEGQMFLMIRIADPLTVGMDFLEVSGICYRISKQKSGDKTSPITHLGDMGFTAFYNEADYSAFPLLWPTVIGHRIDQTSPLFTSGPEDLLTSRLEIIVTVVGLRTETGTKILCKTSYLSEEIVWASRFSQSAVLCRKEKLNIGSYGLEDMERVRKDELAPLVSAERFEMEQREKGALRTATVNHILKSPAKAPFKPSEEKSKADEGSKGV